MADVNIFYTSSFFLKFGPCCTGESDSFLKTEADLNSEFSKLEIPTNVLGALLNHEKRLLVSSRLSLSLSNGTTRSQCTDFH
jgi:hypothetical protein